MGRRRFDDEFEDEDDRPRRRRSPRAEKKNSSPTILILAIVGGVGLLVVVGGIIAAALYWRGSKSSANPATVPGAVASWSFDNAVGGRVIDDTGRGNDATLVGCQLGSGIKGRGLVLDGDMNQYCDLGNRSPLQFTPGAPFTMTGWFRTIEPSGTILSFRHSRMSAQIDILIRDGRLQGIVGDDIDSQSFVWGQPANDGNWHHFALVRSGPAVELYLDGASQGRGMAGLSGSAITTDLHAIGCERRWAITNDLKWGRPGFVGNIDEVSIFSRALTAVEILSLAVR